MQGIDPKYVFWLGLVVTIEMAIAQGTISLTNMIPAAWIPAAVAWNKALAFIGTSVMTGLAGYSSATTGPLLKVPQIPAKLVALFAVIVVSMMMVSGPSVAAPVKLPIDPLGLNAAKGNSSLMQLYQKLQTASLADLQYALNIAKSKNNKASAQCWQAIIDQIQLDQQANVDADGKPLLAPTPHVFTDVQRLSDVVNALGPNSPLMVGCGSFANQAKMNVLQMVSTILSGAAGLAAFAP
jgi:hypothetical protein